MKNNRGEKGFLLLELVVGIAVLAVGITLVIQAFSSAARAHAVSRNMIEAVFLLEDRMQDLGFKERRGLTGKEPAEAAGVQGRFSWKSNFIPVADTSLYLCTLSITWKETGRDYSLAANTYCNGGR